jgi:signal transduction histidine kinase/ligand-binding sensor domain-containing protein
MLTTSPSVFRRIVILFFVSLVQAGTGNIYSQFPPNIITRYTVDDGLAQSTINCILRDRTGFLWVGTCGGLSRFDGHSFISFKSHPDYRNPVSDNFIRWLYEDTSGNIWIGTEKGLDRWDPEKQLIVNAFNTLDSAYKSWFIPFHSPKGKLWFAHGKGISELDIKTGSIKFLAEDKRCANITNVSCQDASGFWFSTLGEPTLVHYDPQSSRLSFISLPDGLSIVNELLTLPAGNVLLATNSGIYIYNSSTGKFESQMLDGIPENEGIKGACIDSRGNYWFGSNTGGYLQCDSTFNIIRKYSPGNEPDISAFPAPVSRLYPDHEGNIWLGTDGSGLYKINPALSKFPLFRFPGNLPQGSNFIRCFAGSAHGKIYVGSMQGGLFLVDPVKELFSRISLSHQGSLSEPTVFCLQNCGNQGILAGTDQGLAFIDRQTSKLVWIVKINPPSQNNQVRALCALPGGRFLAGGHGFLCLFKISEEGKFILLFNRCDSYRINHLFPLENGKVLAGTAEKGFELLRLTANALIREQKTVLPEKYRNTSFRAFYRSRSGELWAATDLGLMHLSDSLEFIELISGNEGLADNDVYGILEDSSNQLWMSTNKGLSCFNPANRNIINYGTKDGLQSAEFNSGAFYSDPEGIMYFGGINGFNYFDPARIRTNQNRAKPVLTAFHVLGGKPEEKLETENHELRLKFFQNFISVETAALEFSNPGENEYAYFLEGQDRSWVYTGTSNFIRYNNLQPGKYILWAMASNNDKQWSEPVSLLTFRLNPPFWKTIWFRISISLGVLTILSIIIWQQFSRRMRRKLEILRRNREIDALRARIARDLHDSAGAALTRISMMGELARMDIKKNMDITPRLESITATSRSLVDNFDEIIWATNPEHDNLDSLISYLRTFVSEFTSELPLEIIYDVEDPLPQLILKPDTRHNVFLIMKECVNNTVKHAIAAKIIIGIQVSEGILGISLLDDGKGFRQEDVRKFGNGIHSMQRRAADIGATIDIRSVPGQGTTISLRCPL